MPKSTKAKKKVSKLKTKITAKQKITIKTPIKPTTIALQRLIPIFSFKKIIARIDIKKGQEKNNALVIASDIKVKEI